MTDNQLFALLRSTILAGLSARGLQGYDVCRSFQPSQQGANSTPTVYLYKVGPDRRHGWMQEKDVWDVNAQAMSHTTSQQYESTFQASVLLTESYDPTSLTPSDVLQAVCDTLQTEEGRAALRAQEVGILRVTDLRNPYDVNDRNQFAADPSFDFVLTYRRTRTAGGPFVVSVDGNVNRV